MGLVKWTRGVRELFVGERERIITWVSGRAYVEFRGVKRDSIQAFGRALEELTEGHPHVSGVQVNPLTRRVVFKLGTGDLAKSYLVALVQAAEQRVLAEPLAALGPHDERALPDDLALDRELSVVAMADAAALLSSVLLRIVPFVPRRLGTNLHGLLFLVSQSDTLRKPLDDRLGRERADFFLRIALASAQGLSQRPLSALVDLSERLVALRELRERRALWQRMGRDLTQFDPEQGVLELSSERAVELPKGPIERYADRAWGVALGSFGVSLLTTRSPSRAIAAGFSALPQPARLGRELFVSELGRLFARHHMLVLSREALRRLDRVDTLVVPAELVSREQFLLADVFSLENVDRPRAMAEARALFSAERPLRVTSASGYTLGPARLVSAGFPEEREAAVREREARGALVLALVRDDLVVALVEVQIFPEVRVSEALRAARKLGLRIVVSSDDVSAAEAIHPDEVVGTGEALRDALTRLASEGRTSMYVGRGASPGYAAADVAVALCKRDEPTPWGAHVLCPDDSRALSLCVEAVSVARSVSEQSVRLAMGAAAFGTLASTGGRANVAARRVMFVVNAASLAAMLDAFRRTHLVEQSSQPGFDPTPWHALSAEGALHRLRSSPERLSLRPDDEPAPSSRLVALRELGAAVQRELENPLSPLLALGAGVSAMVGSVADAGIVAGVGGINAFVGGYQRFKTERAIKELTARARPRVQVQRAGRTVTIGAEELVRGDVLELSAGDLVPADCRILESSALEVDAASLTGESMPVPKSAAPCFAENAGDLSCMLHEGTTVAAGHCTAVVVALGDDTLARRALSVMPDEHRGGVEARLRDLMRMTGPFAVTAGAALVAAGFLRGRRVDDLVATGVGLAVAAVPEGLPVLATAAQLATAQRLSKRGALVKNPRGIEALGRVDVLCMDKTGTLTEGDIELHALHTGAASHSAHDAEVRTLLVSAARAVARGRGERVDPLDAAIVRSSQRVIGDVRSGDFERVAECPFEASRGYESVLARTADGPRLFVKGAPERLFERAHAGEGERIAALTQALTELTSRGLRVLAVAQRALDDVPRESAQAHVEDPQELTLLGLLAFRDPARAQAAKAVADLTQANVRVIMITGDHPGTAHALASDVGLAAAGNVLTGVELASMSDGDLDAAVERVGVFARMSPAQKVRVVRSLQRTGHVVGMVGDGANDAPAMRASDAAIAVGPRSTDAARAAADVVLAEAQIEAIVETVVEGRAMWTAVRDAVSILVGGNLGEIGFTVGIGAITGRSPLSPRQLLLVNFLTDVAPSMAIALRKPSADDLSSLREATPEEALGPALNRDIIARAITTGFGASGAWLFARMTGGATRARTVGLVGLVGSQLGQTLIQGKNDRAVMWTSLASLAALGVIVQTPGVSQLFGCRPIGPIAWGTGLAASATATALSPLVERAVGGTLTLAERFKEELAAFASGTIREGHELPEESAGE